MLAPLKVLICLAAMMHGEARGEGDTGMLAVAKVAIQRNVENPCKAVQQPKQFQGYSKEIKPTLHELVLAQYAIQGIGPDTKKATHFLRVGSQPYWFKDYKVVTVIGNHEFLVKKI